MARFFTLASGSSGNSAYAGSSEVGILVDAGISCRSILAGLDAQRVPLEQIQAVFITHEHIDHIRGLKVLMKRLQVPLYASEPVLDFLTVNDAVPAGTQLEPIKGESVSVAGMRVSSFRTSHDSIHSLGFRIETADNRRIGICTDLGFVSDEVRRNLSGCELVLLESNYEPAMLMNGRYPYYLKKRIAGQKGHLSNEDCAAFLPELVRTGTSRIILAHLSRENNHPDLAYQTAFSGLCNSRMAMGEDYILSVAKRSEPGECLIF